MGLENYNKFMGMISENSTKYFTGKEIKEVVLKCLSEHISVIGRRTWVELADFKINYIDCIYPLSDEGLYYITWDWRVSQYKCYKKKDSMSYSERVRLIKTVEAMISHGYIKGSDNIKYNYGRDIKDAVLKCLEDKDCIIRKELLKFKNKYISCKYPLSDRKLYALAWEFDSECASLVCYKKD